MTDSFQDDLLAPPVYTRPSEYNGMKVPDVLLSGHKRKLMNGGWRRLFKEQKIEDQIFIISLKNH